MSVSVIFEALPGVLGNMGKRAFISGEQGNKNFKCQLFKSTDMKWLSVGRYKKGTEGRCITIVYKSKGPFSSLFVLDALHKYQARGCS